MAVFGGAAFEPMISQKSADEQGRPSWRDLVRDAWKYHQGDECALVLSTDTKKRVWWRGRAGRVGRNTPVLVYDMGFSIFRVISIDWPAMLEDLDVIESIYSYGFSKGALNSSLLGESKTIAKIGLLKTIDAEKQLSQLRQQEHFLFCLLIAQATETEVECTSTESVSQPAEAKAATGTKCTEPFAQASLFDW
jgi:hypothetical protein